MFNRADDPRLARDRMGLCMEEISRGCSISLLAFTARGVGARASSRPGRVRALAKAPLCGVSANFRSALPCSGIPVYRRLGVNGWGLRLRVRACAKGQASVGDRDRPCLAGVSDTR